MTWTFNPRQARVTTDTHTKTEVQMLVCLKDKMRYKWKTDRWIILLIDQLTAGTDVNCHVFKCVLCA